MMSLKEIKELNNKFKKNKEIAYKYDGTELRTLNGEHIGLDLMLSDEGLELQICKVNEINYTKNGKEKIWETFAFEEINIDKLETDEELDKYLEYVVNFYENRVKVVENQQEKLALGILKLVETHKILKELNFSDCVLNEIDSITDDLKGLIEDENIEKIIKESEKYV